MNVYVFAGVACSMHALYKRHSLVSQSLTMWLSTEYIFGAEMVTIWTLVFRYLSLCVLMLSDLFFLNDFNRCVECAAGGFVRAQPIELLDFICYILSSLFACTNLKRMKFVTNTNTHHVYLWIGGSAIRYVRPEYAAMSVEGFALDFFDGFLNFHFGFACESRFCGTTYIDFIRHTHTHTFEYQALHSVSRYMVFLVYCICLASVQKVHRLFQKKNQAIWNVGRLNLMIRNENQTHHRFRLLTLCHLFLCFGYHAQYT